MPHCGLKAGKNSDKTAVDTYLAYRNKNVVMKCV